MRPLLKIITLAGITVMLTACSVKDANKSNFGKAIQAYLDTQHGLCINVPVGFPFTLSSQGIFLPIEKAQADALVDAGLLSKQATRAREMFGNRMVPATQYDITDTGKKYYVPQTPGAARQNGFCTGSYVLVAVDNFSAPSDMLGQKISQVNFHYKLKDPASWINTASLQTAYGIADQTSGDIKGEAVLILTNDGWIHEALFNH